MAQLPPRSRQARAAERLITAPRVGPGASLQSIPCSWPIESLFALASGSLPSSARQSWLGRPCRWLGLWSWSTPGSYTCCSWA